MDFKPRLGMVKEMDWRYSKMIKWTLRVNFFLISNKYRGENNA